MPEYRVIWQIDLDADSPEDAARKAREIQEDRDSENSAHVYDVHLGFDIGERITTVDLDAGITRERWILSPGPGSIVEHPQT